MRVSKGSKCSRRNAFAYLYLPKRTKFYRRMEIDAPLVIEFKDGNTLEIGIEMNPEYLISMNHIPLGVAKNTGDGVDPSFLFSDVIGKKICAVDLETKIEMDPKPTEYVTAICLRFENGGKLRISGFFDFLDVESVDRAGGTKQVSWESIRDGVTTIADRTVDTTSGFIARGEQLLFGPKGRRFAGGHCVTIAPGPGWSSILCSGREAYLSSADSVVLGIAVAMLSANFLQESSGTFDLTYGEWQSALAQMTKMVNGKLLARGADSATVRMMFAASLIRNAQRPVSDRVEETKLAACFVERQMDLLSDLIGWTKRALKPGTILRITGL
ncbi:MAG: hypothetical protein ACI4QT_10400 [Kiritimatiellia bacterium]